CGYCPASRRSWTRARSCSMSSLARACASSGAVIGRMVSRASVDSPSGGDTAEEGRVPIEHDGPPVVLGGVGGTRGAKAGAEALVGHQAVDHRLEDRVAAEPQAAARAR